MAAAFCRHNVGVTQVPMLIRNGQRIETRGSLRGPSRRASSGASCEIVNRGPTGSHRKRLQTRTVDRCRHEGRESPSMVRRATSKVALARSGNAFRKESICCDRHKQSHFGDSCFDREALGVIPALSVVCGFRSSAGLVAGSGCPSLRQHCRWRRALNLVILGSEPKGRGDPVPGLPVDGVTSLRSGGVVWPHEPFASATGLDQISGDIGTTARQIWRGSSMRQGRRFSCRISAAPGKRPTCRSLSCGT